MNTELRDNLGNFVNRSLKFVSQYFDHRIPEPTLREDEHKFIEQAERGFLEYIRLLEKVKIKDALHEVMKLSFLGNKYAQDQKVRFFPSPSFHIQCSFLSTAMGEAEKWRHCYLRNGCVRAR